MNELDRPEGWELRRLDTIGAIYSGSTPSTSTPAYWDGDIVWITPYDLSNSRTPYLHDSHKKITRKGLNSCSLHLLPPGCVVISSRAPIGYVALPMVDFCTNQGCKTIRLSNGYNAEFCYYNILFHVNKLKRIGEGTTFAEISKTALSSVKLSFPNSYDEQEKIAGVLLEIDQAITQTEAVLAKQDRIKSGLIHSLLTCGIKEGRLRRRELHAFKDSLVGPIPEEWEISELGRRAFVTKLAGFEFTKYFDYGLGGEIIALRALNIKQQRLDLSDVQRIPHEISNKLPRSKVYADDILITYIGAYIGDVLRITENDRYHLAPNVAKIVAGKKIHPPFLEWALRSRGCQNQIKNLTATTATPSLTMSQIRKLLIAAPKDIQEQEEIAKRIEGAAQAVDVVEEQLAKFRSLRTAVTHDLLTGKKRLALHDQESRHEKAYA